MTTQNSSDSQYQEMRDLDPEVYAAINGEIARQRDTLEMIASENFVPRAVLQAPSLPTSTQRATQVAATTVDVSTSISSKIWRVTALRLCSALSLPMYSHTPVHRQTLPSLLLLSTQAIRSWAFLWLTVVT